MKKFSLNTKATFIFALMYMILFSAVFLFKLTFSLQALILSFGGLIAIWLAGHRLEPKYYLGAQIFLFFAEGLGAGLQFYALISFYDVIMHLCSGILLSFLGEYSLKILNKGKNTSLPKTIHHTYCLLFSVACAGLWEIWEFSGDKIFGLDSQLGSLDDTMTDIISGTTGSVIGVIILIAIKKISRTTTDKKT